jgi:hypothetical protein
MPSSSVDRYRGQRYTEAALAGATIRPQQWNEGAPAVPKVGVLSGRDHAFPEAVIAAVNARLEPVTAEPIVLDGVRMAEVPGYDAILDRISHRYPFYQSYLKNAALRGVRVVNDPFWSLAVDRFVSLGIARRLGIATPQAVLLANRSHVEGVVEESLRNRADPLDWEGATALVGWPCLVRPHRSGPAATGPLVVASREVLAATWDASSTHQLLLEERVSWTQYLRCIVVGEEVRVLFVQPREPHLATAAVAAGEPDADVAARVAADARSFAAAMAFQIATVDFAVRDGTPLMVEWDGAEPPLGPAALPERDFRWAVDRTAALLTRLAEGPAERDYRWNRLVAHP